MSTSTVPRHPLGKNGPKVPALGLGLMGLTYKSYGEIGSDEERFAFLDRAAELGSTFWDTSDLYGDGEELIGKWLKRTGKRDQIFLATKFGFVVGEGLAVDSSAAYCKAACEKSLERLGIDSIDLYYAHSVNPETPIEETMRALAELQAEGKIKHIGLSTVSSATLRRAVKIAPVAAVQTEYSVFGREIENDEGTDLLATCRELEVALVIATPLGRGVLTSTFSQGENLSDETDMRPKVMPRFLEGNRSQNEKLVSQFKMFADKKGCSIAQLALSWLLKQGEDIFPIPGTKRVRYLEDNWASLDINLSNEEELEIRQFAEANKLAGATVPPPFADWIFRNTKEESLS